MQLNLPQQENGKPYLSYSQYTSWKDKKSFNLGTQGKLEYMLTYFMGHKFEDPISKVWGEFGSKVGRALELNDFTGFTEKEIETLKKVERLDIFEYRIDIEFNGFFLKGFIDTATKDLKHIRDYKTASNNSRKKYEKDDYSQLNIYAEGVKREKGYYPEKMDVEIIERKGNPFKGETLKVGDAIWRIEKEVDEKKIKEVMDDIQKTAEEISKYYTLYQKVNEVK